ncbi:MAG: hypothetical protein ACFE92_02470 [Promethearchaeota archaeon]
MISIIGAISSIIASSVISKVKSNQESVELAPFALVLTLRSFHALHT